jgi:hypothetical protein
MVTAPEARPSSPATAVSWQLSYQPGRDQSSGPSPAVTPFMRGPAWATTPAPCTGVLIVTDQVG